MKKTRMPDDSLTEVNQTVRKFFKKYFVDAMSSMALGLFASLLIGVILQQIFMRVTWEPLRQLGDLIVTHTSASSPVVGAAIGVAIAYSFKSKQLVLFTSAVVGAIGYSVASGGVAAGPVGAYVAVCVAASLGNLIAGKTRLDILLVPTICLLSGGVVAMLIGPGVAQLMRSLGTLVNEATLLQPFLMGIVVSGLMSVILFSPLSSAAIAIMLDLSGLAAGAATAGCAASMIGYAAASWRDNKIGGVLAQALGTSMLQIGNTMRHPQILIPSTVAAVVGGPLATLVFKMTNNALGAGMGTSGLVGPITTLQVMGATEPALHVGLKILALHLVIPAVIAFAVNEFMFRRGWIRKGYYALDQV